MTFTKFHVVCHCFITRNVNSIAVTSLMRVNSLVNVKGVGVMVENNKGDIAKEIKKN